MGLNVLGHRRHRLYDLRLETAGVDSISGQPGDDSRLFFERVVDVAGVHRNHVRGLVAGKTGILKFKREGCRVGDPE